MPVDLPVELIVRILCELDLQALHVCMRVSKDFNRTIKESAVVQYQLELLSNGLVDGPPGLRRFMSAASRYQALVDLEDAWFNLRPRKETRLEGAQHGSLYELAGGLWARGYRGRDAGGARISFRALPSVVRGLETREIFHKDRLENIRDFAMDPGQDLFIFAERVRTFGDPGGHYLINIRTITGNVQHPHALKETLEFQDDGLHQHEAFTFQICGPMLVVLFSFDRNDDSNSVLVIWNWQTGKRLASREGGQRKISSFTLVTPTLLMTSEYYTPPQQLENRDNEPRLVIFRLEEQADQTLELVYAQTLRLPPLHRSHPWSRRRIFIDDLTIRSDPAPVIPSDSSFLAPPFYLNSTHRIFVVTLKTFQLVHHFAMDMSYTFNFCIPYKTIIESLSKPDSEPWVPPPDTRQRTMNIPGAFMPAQPEIDDEEENEDDIMDVDDLPWEEPDVAFDNEFDDAFDEMEQDDDGWSTEEDEIDPEIVDMGLPQIPNVDHHPHHHHPNIHQQMAHELENLVLEHPEIVDALQNVNAADIEIVEQAPAQVVEQPYGLKWDDWGDEGASIAVTGPPTHVCFVYGMRYATISRTEQHPNPVLVVLDFSPYALEKTRRLQAAADDNPPPLADAGFSRTIKQDTEPLQPSTDAFAIGAIGKLPFVETMKELSTDVRSVLIDGENVLFIT
ncbi:hypothetical protein SISNIDRAFT_451330, partial [Sistotremastrum niveocremeum HHB9708]